MKVSTTTTCHRQADDTSTGLCAGGLAVITPHTHKHKSMHAHTLLTGRQLKVPDSGFGFTLYGCRFTVCNDKLYYTPSPVIEMLTLFCVLCSEAVTLTTVYVLIKCRLLPSFFFFQIF